MRARRLLVPAAALVLAIGACGDGPSGAEGSAAGRDAAGQDEAAPATPATTAAPVPATTPATVPAPDRPDWLGTRVLPTGPDGTAAGQPTPPELDPRRIPTVDLLPPPADGAFHGTVDAVPPDVVARSTWQAACPVALGDLRYVTVSFWGYDDRPHTGELLVEQGSAEGLTRVFERLFAARYPIEEMRITSPAELDAPPTGDGNNTSAFVCRPTRGSTTWSQHAYGLAVDVNPFANPYVKGDRVLPELATSYQDRANLRPGMIVAGDQVVDAFADIGWEWGGAWGSPIDTMHFSRDDR
ncbi:MAG TPA: M15 family metallopeptidase [Acidimicrobiales bacterium]|nr:M15 family metallopeptidase [Acidimicrobiales bacterium]